MKAMILAAGLGTRLKPITDHIPKALVEVDNVPILERVITSLKNQGFTYLVINVHHFASQIIDFIQEKDFGIKIEISDETEELLDTGGGIVKASPLLFRDDDQPVLIHNVDILSNARLCDLMNYSSKDPKECCLLINHRDSSRKLIFDENLELTGWHDLKNNKFRLLEGANENSGEFAFSGIYSLSRNACEEMKHLLGEKKFSIMEYFLHPERKLCVKGVFQNNLKVLDIGKPATLSQASEVLNALNNQIN